MNIHSAKFGAKLPSGWCQLPLNEVCTLIKRGIAPKYIDEGGIRVVNQKCVRDHVVNFELARRNDPKKKRVPNERLIQHGDVLVNSTGTGTLGRVAQVLGDPSEPTTVDTHVTIVRPINGIFFPSFFGYVMIAIEAALEAAGRGAVGQTELPRSDLAEKFFATFPQSLEEQKRIVAVLDKAFAALDRARANAEANLADAEELMQSVIDDIFHIDAPDWTQCTLGDICKFVGGSQPPKSVFKYSMEPSLIRLIQIRDYKSDKNAVYVPKALAKRFCNSDDVMIGRYGPPLFQILRGLEGAYNVALMKAVPDQNRLTKDFLFYFLKNRNILRYIIKSSNRAAGQAGINKATIEPYPISYPSLSEQEVIVDRLNGVLERSTKVVSTYHKKITEISTLRQSILQKAFAGELT